MDFGARSQLRRLSRGPVWLRNFRKRLVKAPKLHFVDSGLACHLLGIRDPDQLRVHPLRGALFESWCASEVLKARGNVQSAAPRRQQVS